MLFLRVFVDTNIYKYAATKLPRLRPRPIKLNWGGKDTDTTVHNFVTVNPNLNIKNNPQLRAEVELIPEIVAMQSNEKIKFCETAESMLEKWGLPNMDSETGNLYGAEITTIEAPIKYSRNLMGWNFDAYEEQAKFLGKIKNSRFLEIQKATGAYQGANAPNRNQLLDAFHLWCAEGAKCDAFLTGEAQKLRRLMSQKRNFKFEPSIVLPSELLKMIENTKYKSLKGKIKRNLRKKGWIAPLF